MFPRPVGALLLIPCVLGLAPSASADPRPTYHAPFTAMPLPGEGGVALVADLDRDGILDLIVAAVGPEPVLLPFRGRGDGRFDPLRTIPADVERPTLAVGDVTGDGAPDLIELTGASPPSWLLVGDGAGGIADRRPIHEIPYGASTPMLADLDGDGPLDLVFHQAGGPDDGWRVARGAGDGSFIDVAPVMAAQGPGEATLADLDGDGALDLVAIDVAGPRIRVARGAGNGTFEPPQDHPLMSDVAGLAVADLDLDGWPDLCFTRPRSDPAVLVLRGRGDGTFDDPRAYWTEFPAGAVVIARLDGDGPPDVVVAAASSVIALPGRGDGTLGGPILVRSAPPAGLLAADFDRDGRTDLAAVGAFGHSIALYPGNGDFTFGSDIHVDYGEPSYHGGALADLDGEGHPDLVVPMTYSGKLRVYRNGSGGLMAPFDLPVGLGPEDVAIGDLDHDGILDLAVANVSSNTVSIVPGRGGLTFGPRSDFETGISPRALALADLDGDGRLDVATANEIAGTVSVLLGRGDGTLAPRIDLACAPGPWSIAAGDVDRDGRADLVVAGSRGDRVTVLLDPAAGASGGAGTRAPAAVDVVVGDSPRAVGLADFDRDGLLDLVVTHGASAPGLLAILPGDGAGGFGPAREHDVPGIPEDLAIADLDADGTLDVAVAGANDHAIGVLYGTATGVLIDRSDFGTGAGPRFVAAADFDDDGRLDLIAGASEGVWLLMREDDGPTALQAAAMEWHVAAGAVQIRWQVSRDLEWADVVRRDGDGAWRRIAAVAVDARGMVEFEDGSIRAGGRYDYALEIGGRRLAEVHVTVPLAAAFALHGLIPNPSSGAGRVAFSLADDGPARLEILDLSGRRIVARDLDGMGAGTHRLRLDDGGRVPPGIYWLRLIQGARSAAIRACVIE